MLNTLFKMKSFLIVFVLIYAQIRRTLSQEFDISFDPPLIRGLTQWKTTNITFKVGLNNDTSINNMINDEFELRLNIIQNSQYPRQVIEFTEDNTYRFKITENEPTFSSEFKIKALFLGYSNITFRIYNNNKSFSQILDNYSVSVVRQSSVFDIFFGIIIISLVTVNYVNMGCHMDLEVVKKTLKMPIGPMIGFVCQFTIMPLVSINFFCITHFYLLRIGFNKNQINSSFGVLLFFMRVWE